MNNMKELNVNEMENVSGGVLSDSQKKYLKSMIKVSKRNGCVSLEQFLKGYGGNGDQEVINYIRSVWDSI